MNNINCELKKMNTDFFLMNKLKLHDSQRTKIKEKKKMKIIVKKLRKSSSWKKKLI